eukprot:scaffold123466_cov22-Tisochrysis_lutea.AAC.1
MHTEAEGMTDVRTADWSDEVAPFWKAVIQTALSGAGFAGLLRAGWTTIKLTKDSGRHTMDFKRLFSSQSEIRAS